MLSKQLASLTESPTLAIMYPATSSRDQPLISAKKGIFMRPESEHNPEYEPMPEQGEQQAGVEITDYPHSNNPARRSNSPKGDSSTTNPSRNINRGSVQEQLKADRKMIPYITWVGRGAGLIVIIYFFTLLFIQPRPSWLKMNEQLPFILLLLAVSLTTTITTIRRSNHDDRGYSLWTVGCLGIILGLIILLIAFFYWLHVL